MGDSYRFVSCLFSVSYCAVSETYPQMYPVLIDARPSHRQDDPWASPRVLGSFSFLM